MITERTPNGYLMELKVISSGRRIMMLRCPQASSEGGGNSLGASDPVKARKGQPFKASNGARWHFHGTLDASNHFKGKGRIRPGLCGDAPRHFTEPIPNQPRWTSWPPTGPNNPNTPLTFKGVLKGAALGTKVQIEYSQGPGPEPTASAASQVDVVRTDAAGKFKDTRAFEAPPPGTPFVQYNATARYGAKTAVCSFEIVGPVGP